MLIVVVDFADRELRHRQIRRRPLEGRGQES